MECPLCFENYNDLLKKPRNLECGHTFCEICLSKLFSNNFIICPACRRQSSSPPKSLPVNFIAADLARKYLEEKKKYQFCETHSKEIIRFFCNTCSSRICIECIVDHCGHLFVKQEESIRLLQLKINEIDCQISKNIDKNNEVIFEVKEISHSLDKKLLKLPTMSTIYRNQISSRAKIYTVRIVFRFNSFHQRPVNLFLQVF